MNRTTSVPKSVPSLVVNKVKLVFKSVPKSVPQLVVNKVKLVLKSVAFIPLAVKLLDKRLCKD